MNKICSLSRILLLLNLFLLFSVVAYASDDVAYFVASDEIFNQITGIRNYLTNDGVKIVQIKPSELDKLKDIKRFVVFGSPDATDAIGDLIRTSLNETQLNNARRMGKATFVAASVSGKDAIFFATSFGMTSLVKSSANSWKECFESWYGVKIPVTQIIGY